MEHKESHAMPEQQMQDKKMYQKLLISTVISYIVMYLAMFAMINSAGNFFNNVNMVYMAGLMAAPMVVIMLLIMNKMYKDKKLNTILITIALLSTLIFYVFIRQQSAVGDKQFLRSMIPHHAGAILMCEQASITDQEIKDLCVEIVEAQVSEIDQMKSILERLEK